ncbi:hypothetical protein V6N13_077184 [Hibiscus sabdariffa]
MGDLLLAKEVTDLDGLVGVGDGGVDGKVSVDEPHLVTVALGDAGDEILDVAEGGADGGAGFPGAEPSLDPELALAGLLVLGEMEVEVEVLEVAGELAPGALNLDHLRLHLDVNTIGDVHRLRRKYGLHFSGSLVSLSLSLRRRLRVKEEALVKP